MRYIPTAGMTADLLTKHMEGSSFYKHRNTMYAQHKLMLTSNCRVCWNIRSSTVIQLHNALSYALKYVCQIDMST
jgi:hypothetical protein